MGNSNELKAIILLFCIVQTGLILFLLDCSKINKINKQQSSSGDSIKQEKSLWSRRLLEHTEAGADLINSINKTYLAKQDEAFKSILRNNGKISKINQIQNVRLEPKQLPFIQLDTQKIYINNNVVRSRCIIIV
jgi:hypothetical protein